MGKLYLLFTIRLKDFLTHGEPNGPLFDRWLPDGRNDAVALNTGDGHATLTVWFERMGYTEKGRIVFDERQRDIEPSVMGTQTHLQAGHLFGLLEVRDLADGELVGVRDDRLDDPQYIALGKRVLELIYPPVARFLNTVRTNYGQFWITELDEWDSRADSLSAYLEQKFSLRWTEDGKTWKDFRPGEWKVVMGRPQFRGGLTQEDWRGLAEVDRSKYAPSLAAHLIARTRRLLDQWNLRHAFVEAVSALEIALYEFVRGRVTSLDRELLGKMTSFWEMPLPAQLIVVAAVVGGISDEDLTLAMKAIGIRNDVIHDGWNPQEDQISELLGLLRVAGKLLQGPVFRVPSAGAARMRAKFHIGPAVEKERHSQDP
jgi:hypothetical protein